MEATKSPNEAKYKTIYEKKKATPAEPLTKLCNLEGVSYQSYNNWLKRQLQASESSAHKIRLSVMLSVEDLAKLILENAREIPMSVDRLVKSLAPEERKKLAQEIGMAQLEDLVKVMSGNA